MSDLSLIVKKFQQAAFGFFIIGISLVILSLCFGVFVANNPDKVSAKFTTYAIKDINDLIEKRTNELEIQKREASTENEIQMISEIQRLIDFILNQNERAIKAMFQIASLFLFFAGFIFILRSINDFIFIKRIKKQIN